MTGVLQQFPASANQQRSVARLARRQITRAYAVARSGCSGKSVCVSLARSNCSMSAGRWSGPSGELAVGGDQCQRPLGVDGVNGRPRKSDCSEHVDDLDAAVFNDNFGSPKCAPTQTAYQCKPWPGEKQGGQAISDDECYQHDATQQRDSPCQCSTEPWPEDFSHPTIVPRRRPPSWADGQRLRAIIGRRPERTLIL